MSTPGPISTFIEHHYRHFNAAALKDAARSYTAHLEKGGSMFMTIAGAMSTAELGLSLAEMIRQGKVHAICCTGANLEEDVFNLVAHDFYERVPNYRDLTPADEMGLLERHMNRVTDTCIPEMEAIRERLFSPQHGPCEEAVGMDLLERRHFLAGLRVAALLDGGEDVLVFHCADHRRGRAGVLQAERLICEECGLGDGDASGRRRRRRRRHGGEG
jgi:hypothetical protein